MSTAQNVAQGTATGAAIGSVVPGVGTAIGGTVGGVVAGATDLYKSWFGDTRGDAQRERDAIREYLRDTGGFTVNPGGSAKSWMLQKWGTAPLKAILELYVEFGHPVRAAYQVGSGKSATPGILTEANATDLNKWYSYFRSGIQTQQQPADQFTKSAINGSEMAIPFYGWIIAFFVIVAFFIFKR
jgi:hypothetical protein